MNCTLAGLDLRWNELTTEGAAVIINALKVACRHMHCILRGFIIQMNKSLNRLDLRFNKLGPTCVAVLVDAFKAMQRGGRMQLSSQVNQTLTSFDLDEEVDIGPEVATLISGALKVVVCGSLTPAVSFRGILSFYHCTLCWRRMWRACGRPPPPAPAYPCRQCGRHSLAIHGCSSGM